MKYYSLGIGENEFSLSDGGSVYDPVVGGDSYSANSFFMQAGGYIKGTEYEIYDWMDGASELMKLGASVSVDAINDSDDIDWDEKLDEESMD